MPICVYRRTLAAQAGRQEGEGRGAGRREKWNSGTSTVEGSGAEGWISAGQQWKVKTALESTRVFCGGSA